MAGATVLMTSDDGTLPCRVGEEKELLAYRKQFEIDQYYPAIAAHTFFTQFVDITIDEVRAWREYNRGATLTHDQQAHINGMMTRLDASIANVRAARGAHSVFVRLSTRSPKDAVDKMPSVIHPLLVSELRASADDLLDEQKALSSTPSSSPAVSSSATPAPSPSPAVPSTASSSMNGEQLSRRKEANAHLLALRRSFFHALSVTTAKQVFDIMALSSRAVSDIKRALDYAADQEWSLKLIVREFVTIPLQGEFRGFVHHGQLNALSQYYADSFFWRLVRQRDDIATRVLTFYTTTIRPLLTHLDSYIIDFAVTDDRVMMIELNPFSEATGACLFDWKKDKHIIDNGPYQLRVNDAPLSTVEASLIPWRSLLEPALAQLRGTPHVTNTDTTKGNGNDNGSNGHGNGKDGKCTIM